MGSRGEQGKKTKQQTTNKQPHTQNTQPNKKRQSKPHSLRFSGFKLNHGLY